MVENIIQGIQLGIKSTIVNFLKWCLAGIVSNAFWICLIVCMCCLVLYIGGLKKAGRICTVSLVVYIVLEALGCAFL